MAAAMDPIYAAEQVLAGIRRNDLFILTHQEFQAATRERGEALMASFPTEPAPLLRQQTAATFVPPMYGIEAARRSR
jgi:hypothetical protein